MSISEFSKGLLTFLPFKLLLVRSHQAQTIIVKRPIQGRNNVLCATRVGVEHRSRDRGHTVAVKTAIYPSWPRCRQMRLYKLFFVKN